MTLQFQDERIGASVRRDVRRLRCVRASSDFGSGSGGLLHNERGTIIDVKDIPSPGGLTFARVRRIFYNTPDILGIFISVCWREAGYPGTFIVPVRCVTFHETSPTTLIG